jgi:hypothetical protein
VFNKVPTVGGIFGNLSALTRKLAPVQNIIGRISGITSLISGEQKGPFDPSKFINNIPSQSLIAGDYNFKDLVSNSQNGVVKKVLKSNYNGLIH